MHRNVHVRNVIIALAVVSSILFISIIQPFASTNNNVLAAPPQQAVDFFWNPASGAIDVQQNQSRDFNSTLQNTGVAGNFRIAAVDVPEGWTVTIAPATFVAIPANTSRQFTFTISAPPTLNNATTFRIQITAEREAVPGVTSRLTLTINPIPPTSTPTQTNTPTATTGPTATPAPTCRGGAEANDPGESLDDAQLILVDVPTERGICVIGDEDWYKFGAVGGKVYTIDVSEMAAGLDLSIDLFDEQGNLLTNNDDFFRRDPAAPDPTDIKPRIQSWRAPRDGMYFFRVRDTRNLGGGDRTYTVVVLSESYGPTPITIPEVCRDLYEEDGLPEEARLITSNEVQPRKVLCPTGDADWVKFFGKAGKTYYLYTDTRPYRNNPDINNQTEAGADTVLYLADRDGVSIIDFNDDIPGGSTLDSEIRFTPTADGFYYAQVKNIGDIGNQFIRYDLTLKLWLPGEECGRSPVSQLTPTTRGGTGGATVTPTLRATPTETDFLDQTDVAQATQTAIANTQTALAATLTATSTEESFIPYTQKSSTMVNGPLQGFADAAFEQVWQRNDRPVAEQRTSRSWSWGPRGLMARTEGYIQATSGLRQVQYFDKARMEINNPAGDRNSRWFVTTGLLVIELITGRTQIGDNEYIQREPANIPIAGDIDDPNGPTYASFGGVTGEFPGDRTGQIARETINRAGQVGTYTGPERPETRLVQFVPESGHNIPQVFWDYLHARGTVYENGRYDQNTLVDWVFTLGYPISEPYWTRIRVGGVERDVLVQAFQRRVLTYLPDNPRGWQVEMGNVGRHYYFWRYGEQLPS